MTSDPVRLLKGIDAGDEAELERELLRSIADVSPPPDAQGRAWDGIATRIAAASALAAGASVVARAGASAAAPASVATKAGPVVAAGIANAFATKVVVGALIATAAAGGVWKTYSHWSGRAKPVAASPALQGVFTAGATPAPETVAPVAARPLAATHDDGPSGSGPIEARGSKALGGASAATRARSDEALAIESALLTEARASLQKGDPRGALATLHRLDARSPHGVLRQEREVLAVQALAASGDRVAASRRAAAFVKAYPNSPHTPLLRRLVSEL